MFWKTSLQTQIIDVRDLGFVLYRKQGNVYIHGYKKVKEIPDGWNTGEEQDIELGIAPNTIVAQNILPFSFSTLKELNPVVKDVWVSPSQNYVFLQEGEELVIIEATLKKEMYRVAFPKGRVVFLNGQ